MNIMNIMSICILSKASNVLTQYRPLHAIKSHNYFETEDKLCSMMSNCSKLMLEFGADFSLEGSGGGGIWESSFVEDLCYNSIVDRAPSNELRSMLIIIRQH